MLDEVHISVTFSWDLEKAEELFEAWQILGVPVLVGGPAFDDRMGDFTPGVYTKPGAVFTSRGCQKECWFCSVPKCPHGVIRELPIYDGCDCDHFIPHLSETEGDYELEPVCSYNTEFDCPFCGETVYVYDIGVEGTEIVTCDECGKQAA